MEERNAGNRQHDPSALAEHNLIWEGYIKGIQTFMVKQKQIGIEIRQCIAPNIKGDLFKHQENLILRSDGLVIEFIQSNGT